MSSSFAVEVGLSPTPGTHATPDNTTTAPATLDEIPDSIPETQDSEIPTSYQVIHGDGINIFDVTEAEEEDTDDDELVPPDILQSINAANAENHGSRERLDIPWINDGLPSYPSIRGQWLLRDDPTTPRNDAQHDRSSPFGFEVPVLFTHFALPLQGYQTQRIVQFCCKVTHSRSDINSIFHLR